MILTQPSIPKLCEISPFVPIEAFQSTKQRDSQSNTTYLDQHEEKLGLATNQATESLQSRQQSRRNAAGRRSVGTKGQGGCKITTYIEHTFCGKGDEAMGVCHRHMSTGDSDVLPVRTHMGFGTGRVGTGRGSRGSDTMTAMAHVKDSQLGGWRIVSRTTYEVAQWPWSLFSSLFSSFLLLSETNACLCFVKTHDIRCGKGLPVAVTVTATK